MIQPNELMNLLVDCMSIPVIVLVFRDRDLPRYPLFFTGLFAIVCAHIFTVAEGFVLFDFFNIAEHLSMVMAALLFFAGVVRYFGPSKRNI